MHALSTADVTHDTAKRWFQGYCNYRTGPKLFHT
jgi:hypothetical protein